MLKNLKWIFFDLGWTLVDETKAHCVRLSSVSEQISQFGLQYSVDQLLTLCEQASTQFAPRGMLEGLNLTDSQITPIMDSDSYATENEVLYPGVPDLLSVLSKHFRLGVIANQSKGTEERLVRWGIREYFSTVFASAEYGLSKPDPRIFAAAQAEVDCKPEEILMVGDRLDNDIGPAKSQGWQTLRVLQGFSRFQESRNPEEVPDITATTIKSITGKIYG